MVDPQGLEMALTDRVLVSFRPGVSASERQAMARNVGTILIDEHEDFIATVKRSKGPT